LAFNCKRSAVRAVLSRISLLIIIYSMFKQQCASEKFLAFSSAYTLGRRLRYLLDNTGFF